MSLNVESHLDEKELIINNIIVYFTYVLIVLSVFSCIVMYSCRRGKAKGDKSTEEVLRLGTAPASAKKKKSVKIADNATDNSDDREVINAEEGRSEKLEAFKSRSFDGLLESGVKLTLHGPKGPLMVSVKIEECMLLVQNTKSRTARSIKFNLEEVSRVQRGARPGSSKMKSAMEIAAEVSSKKGQAMLLVPDEECFTLVNSKSGNLDFQAASKIECDALVDGFERKLSMIQASKESTASGSK